MFAMSVYAPHAAARRRISQPKPDITAAHGHYCIEEAAALVSRHATLISRCQPRHGIIISSLAAFFADSHC